MRLSAAINIILDFTVIGLLLLVQYSCNSNAATKVDYYNITIYHIIDNALWGEVDGSYLQGQFPCAGDLRLHCEIHSSDTKSRFFDTVHAKYDKHKAYWSLVGRQPITVSLYNIHTWREITRRWPQSPDRCNLPTHFTMAESEESFGRFGHIFHKSFPLFDGNSTTHPKSTVPRSYITCLNQSDFLPLRPPAELISGAAYVASTCHHGEKIIRREQLVQQLRSHFRVDGLGKCSKTANIPEGIKLTSGATAQETLRLKQAAISRYMFYLAFENTKEPGYVTEKVFDALTAGVVPVYAGATEDCKRLLPLPSGSILYLDDFHNDIQRLASYLQYLTKNLTAYEEHRAWRRSFSTRMLSPMLKKSWPCRVCEWAHRRAVASGVSTDTFIGLSDSNCPVVTK